MEITYKNYQKKIKPNPPQVLKITKMVLRREGVRRAQLSIIFVNHQKIRAFNYKFLKRNHATDVLAFDLSEPPNQTARRKPREIIGDIIISTDAALQNTKRYDTTLAGELALYIIHGILHLLGHDDRRRADIKKMRAKERELLNYLGKRVDKIMD